MRLSKLLLLLIVLMSIISNKSFAYDIEVNGFYYNVLSVTTLEVTYGDKKYSGDVSIPATVTYNGKTYNVVSVGTKAFAECDKLLSIYMGNNINSIGDKAFYKCSSLKDYSFSNCKLGTYVFAYCTSIKNGDLTGVSIPAGTFRGCTSIESLSIKGYLKTIGPYAYADCTSIKGELVFGGGSFKICDSAFENCTGITKILLKPTVEMEIDAFAGCSSLETITLQKDANSNGNITGLGQAFGKCKNLKNIEFNYSDDFYYYRDGAIYANVSWGQYLKFLQPNISTYVTPDWLSYIDAYAFTSIGGLKRVVLSSYLKSIDVNAFTNCPDLKELYCYSKSPITFIDQMYAKDLTEATFIPELTGKLKLYVPKGCKQNYSNKRPWCNFIIKEFDVASFNPYAEYEETEEIDGIKYKITSDTEVEVIHKDDYSGDIVIPETVSINGKDYRVTSIGQSAFLNCTGLKSIVIPNSVIEIGDHSFQGCSGLTDLEIPNSVKTIVDYAFTHCNGLTSVSIPDNVDSIGKNAFWNCKYLSYVKLPNNLHSISTSVFSGCENLLSVEIPSSVETIGDRAFYHCRRLSNIEIPNSVKIIGSSAFSSCDALSTLTIPNSVETIGDNAFNSCTNLIVVYLGANIKKLSYNAFSYCNKLANFYCFSKNIDYVSAAAFQYTNLQNVTLHVPDSAIDYYRSTDPWNKFGNIVALTDDETGINKVLINNEVTDTYLLNGQRTARKKQGISIIRQKDGTTKKVLVK